LKGGINMQQTALEVLNNDEEIEKLVFALDSEAVVDLQLKERIRNRYTTLLVLGVIDKEIFEASFDRYMRSGSVRGLSYEEFKEIVEYQMYEDDDSDDIFDN